MSCFLQNNSLQCQCVSGHIESVFTHCLWFTQLLWYSHMSMKRILSVIALAFCNGFQLGCLTTGSTCLSSIPQMKFESEYSFLLVPFLQQLLIVQTLFMLAVCQSLSLFTVLIILEFECTVL